MSNIPKSKRRWSKLESYYQAKSIRRRITKELLLSFAFKPEKIKKRIDYLVRNYDEETKKEMSTRLIEMEERFAVWFIEQERGRILQLAEDICLNLVAANDIWPTYYKEYIQRRMYLDQAINSCSMLQVQLDYISDSIATNKNKYMNLVLEIDALVNKIKKLRTSDSRRFLKKLRDFKADSANQMIEDETRKRVIESQMDLEARKRREDGGVPRDDKLTNVTPR